MTSHDVCSTEDLAVGEKAVFKVDGLKIIVYHLEDGFYATQHNCTHVFAPLGRGKLIDGAQIQCPFHRACFDIRSGEVVKWANFPPGVQLLNAVRGEKALKTYPVRMDDGRVIVEVE